MQNNAFTPVFEAKSIAGVAKPLGRDGGRQPRLQTTLLRRPAQAKRRS
jgi:hypothetical protein